MGVERALFGHFLDPTVHLMYLVLVGCVLAVRRFSRLYF